MHWFFNTFLSLFQKNASRTTVRYAFPLVILSTLFVTLAALVSQEASHISLKPNVTQATEGTVFYIDVIASVNIPSNAVNVTVTYPKDLVDIENIDTGTSVITIWTQEPYAKDGIVYLRGGTFRKGFVGEHTIARIKAKPRTVGSAHFAVATNEIIAGDGKGTTETVGDDNPDRQVDISIRKKDEALATQVRLTDMNNDGIVNLSDVSIFMDAWFTKSRTFDFNNDGQMTFTDFSILLASSFKN